MKERKEGAVCMGGLEEKGVEEKKKLSAYKRKETR